MPALPRAVIFDFDGVLVNSEPLHLRALREVLAPEDLLIDEASYYRELLGMSDRDTFVYLFRKAGRPLTEARTLDLVRSKSVRMMQLIEAGQTTVLPGAEALLCRLYGLCPLAICSGSRRVEIEATLARENLRQHFDLIVSADDFPIGKPDPRVYLHTLQQLGHCPADCVVVEDSAPVIQGLRPLGFSIVGVATSLPRQRLLDAGAHWAVESLADAIPALDADPMSRPLAPSRTPL